MLFELGWEWLLSGVFYVVICIDMYGCVGVMLEWWFVLWIGICEYCWWYFFDYILLNWVEGILGVVFGVMY